MRSFEEILFQEKSPYARGKNVNLTALVFIWDKNK
jgi:hypothetical protein